MNDMNVVQAQQAIMSASKTVSSNAPQLNSSSQAIVKSEQIFQSDVKEKTVTQADTQNLDVLSNSGEFVNELNAQLKLMQSYLKFEKDDDSNRMVFFIKDSETNEVIRQVPAKELLQISKNISNYLEELNTIKESSSMPVGLITNEVV